MGKKVPEKIVLSDGRVVNDLPTRVGANVIDNARCRVSPFSSLSHVCCWNTVGFIFGLLPHVCGRGHHGAVLELWLGGEEGRSSLGPHCPAAYPH